MITKINEFKKINETENHIFPGDKTKKAIQIANGFGYDFSLDHKQDAKYISYPSDTSSNIPGVHSIHYLLSNLDDTYETWSIEAVVSYNLTINVSPNFSKAVTDTNNYLDLIKFDIRKV